jgi:hypothetical protein
MQELSLRAPASTLSQTAWHSHPLGFRRISKSFSKSTVIDGQSLSIPSAISKQPSLTVCGGCAASPADLRTKTHIYASCVNLAIKLIGRRPLCMWLVANGDWESGLMSSHKTRSVDVSKWIGYPVPSSRCTQIVAMNARSLASVLLEISPENKLVQIAKLGSCHQRNVYPWSLKIFKLYEGNSRMLGQGKHKALFFLKKENQQKRLESGTLNWCVCRMRVIWDNRMILYLDVPLYFVVLFVYFLYEDADGAFNLDGREDAIYMN